MLAGVNTPDGASWRSCCERYPILPQQSGCREGRQLWWEGHCGTVGGPGAGRWWALKVGAHWLRAAAATSTSRRLLCGSRALCSAAAHARVAARRLPRSAPPSRAVCRRCVAAGAAAPLCSGSVCVVAWNKIPPWCAEIASAGGCAWSSVQGGVAGLKPPSSPGLAGGDSVPAVAAGPQLLQWRQNLTGVGVGTRACPLSPQPTW